ncbi:hypothetical protein ACT3RT_22540, partial [Ewingella sp. AOP9-I1-14]
ALVVCCENQEPAIDDQEAEDKSRPQQVAEKLPHENHATAQARSSRNTGSLRHVYCALSGQPRWRSHGSALFNGI